MSMRSRRLHSADANPLFSYWPLGLALATLVAAPAFFGLSFLLPGECVGVVTGVAAGVLVERILARSLSRRASGDVLP